MKKKKRIRYDKFPKCRPGCISFPWELPPLTRWLTRSLARSPPILQTRHDERSILDDADAGHSHGTRSARRGASVGLEHEIGSQTQLAVAAVMLAGASDHGGAGAVHIGGAEGAPDDLGVVGDHGDVTPAAHQLPGLGAQRRAVGRHLEDLHHVFLGVADGAGGAALAVGRDVDGFVGAGAEEFDHVGGWGRVDDEAGD